MTTGRILPRSFNPFGLDVITYSLLVVNANCQKYLPVEMTSYIIQEPEILHGVSS